MQGMRTGVGVPHSRRDPQPSMPVRSCQNPRTILADFSTSAAHWRAYAAAVWVLLAHGPTRLEERFGAEPWQTRTTANVESRRSQRTQAAGQGKHTDRSHRVEARPHRNRRSVEGTSVTSHVVTAIAGPRASSSTCARSTGSGDAARWRMAQQRQMRRSFSLYLPPTILASSLRPTGPPATTG